MFKRNSLSGFLVTFLCVVSFCTCVVVNAKILDVHLSLEGVSYTYFDKVAFLKMMGYIVASVVVVICMSWLSFFRGVMIALPLYYFSCFNLVYLDADNAALMFYYVMYAATFLVMTFLLVDKVLEQETSKPIDSLILIILSYLLSYIAIIYFDIFAIEDQKGDTSFFYAFIVNIVPLSVFGALVFKYYRKKRNVDGYNFNIVIKNMEIEALISFSMFYVIMSVRNGYEVFSLSHNLEDISTNSLNFIIFGTVFISLFLSKIIIPKFNKHNVNIVCLASLIILFLLIHIIGDNEFKLSLVLLLIGVLIFLPLMSTLSILTEKFEGINLACAIAIYVLAASIGNYCGYITIDTSESTLGDNGFLISICFVLMSLLLYYLYLFKKLKLYR